MRWKIDSGWEAVLLRQFRNGSAGPPGYISIPFRELLASSFLFSCFHMRAFTLYHIQPEIVLHQIHPPSFLPPFHYIVALFTCSRPTSSCARKRATHRSGCPLKKTPYMSQVSRSYQSAPLYKPVKLGTGVTSSA